VIASLRIVFLCGLAVLLLGARWTEDQGERGTTADLLALGADVESRVGPPAGGARSGVELDAFTASVAKGVRCPSCQGMSIDASPAEMARNMKRQVRAMGAAGYDGYQIREYFVGAYGEFVLMSPKKEGINLLVWVLPVLIVLLGSWMTVRVVLSRRTTEGEAPASVELEVRPELEPYLAQVRAELADQDG